MSNENDSTIIYPDLFLLNNKIGHFYTGHVLGLGYAFVQRLPYDVVQGNDCYSKIIDIQCIILIIGGREISRALKKSSFLKTKTKNAYDL